MDPESIPISLSILSSSAPPLTAFANSITKKPSAIAAIFVSIIFILPSGNWDLAEFAAFMVP